MYMYHGEMENLVSRCLTNNIWNSVVLPSSAADPDATQKLLLSTALF